MTTVADLAVVLSADITGLSNGLRTAEREVSGFGSSLSSGLKNLGGSMQSLGGAVTTLTAPITAFGLAGLNAASDFEGAMAEIQARTGATAGEMQTISAFALQMGADTAFSGQQAAEGLLQLLTSGQTVEQAMATLGPVLDAAAASGEDLGATADAVTDIMAAFGLPVEDAVVVVDALAQAAGASSASMSDLSAGFANVGPVAENFGLSVGDTAAALAVLSENGIKGAEAGTALKSMLLNMSRDTAEVRGAWETLGTSMYDAEGNMRDLGVVLEEIGTALDGMPVEEQNQVMQDLAGSYGIVALSALTGSLSLDAMRTSMEGQASAAEVADARMDTFAGRLDTLKGSVETLMITALTPLMENVLTPMAERLTEVVNGVTEWAEANPELVSQIAAIAGPLVIVGPALLIVGTALSSLGTIAGVAAAGVGLLLSPVGLLVAAVALLAATLNDAGIQQGLAAWGPAFEAIGMTLRLVGDQVKRDIETFFLNIQARITDFIADFRQRILDATGGQVDIAPQIEFSNYDIEQKLSEMQIADTIARTLTEQVGQANVDLGAMINVETAQASISSTMQGLLNNPGVIANMSEAGKVAIESAISQAATNGDEGTYNALLPIATELDIPIEPLIEDNQLAVDEAAMAPYDATLIVDMTVFPGHIDMTAVQAALTSRLNGLAGGSNGGGFGAAPAPMGIPQFAGGGMMNYDGLAYLHANERVLTPSQNRAYERGGSGGDTFNVTVYGESPYELARMTDRARSRSGARYGTS